MEDTIKIRKDKIKNVAIVFLSIMLVLTFFSNSILNRALPEVATEYVRYDTITERVRGNGVVEADDPYKVVVEDTRTIASVAVSVGDVVTKDQVLFYLEDKESEELKEKEKEVQEKEDELDKEILNYMTAILSVDISNAAFFNIEGDNIASLGAYQAQIEASRQKVQNAQNTVDSLKRQQLVVNMEPASDVEQEKQLAAAEAAYESAKNHLESVQAQVEQARAAIISIDQYVGASDTNGDGFGDDLGKNQRHDQSGHRHHDKYAQQLLLNVIQAGHHLLHRGHEEQRAQPPAGADEAGGAVGHIVVRRIGGEGALHP